ncbi:hypothetical protein [Lacipirellula limnantheis]|uniref:Uncharacterized protein n=1 Tax=Lacipirellula limnantheis TaxID=2528024 RepID=A0A517U6B4_9BACT|nr:hypothetical protein [Lacipirellula limnantheis]QDT76175.1 hypothetical protein I41_54200 [Lacipirellula limnantheis]
MSLFQPAEFGPVFEPLVAVDRCRSLGAGRAHAADHKSLQRATLATAFGDAQLVDLDMARCCLAGVWLLHDFLHESHAISQQIETPSGSFWHGVMHRREGDFSNAKYWFRHVGRHAVFDELGPQIESLAGEGDSGALRLIIPAGTFDPFGLVDACQAAVRSGDDGFCRRVQQLEWELLFRHCFRHAIGS